MQGTKMSQRTMKQPHEVKFVNHMPKLVRENISVRFCKAGECPMWMQDGAVFADGGGQILEPPEWIWEQYKTLSPEMQAQLKMVVPLPAGKK